MARLVIEDSDDEFPDLDELLLGKGAGGKKGEVSTMKGGSREDEELGEEAAWKRKSNRKEKEIVAVKKKRVLKRRDDNPLLRPLASTATASEGRKGKAGVKTSRIPEKEVMAASKKKAITSFDSVDEAETRTPPMRSRARPSPVTDPESEEENDSRISSKRAQSRTPTLDLETEEEDDDLSDFIVNDSTFLEEEISEIEMPPPPKPPRSARRLVKGRKPEKKDEELELDMRGLSMEDEAFDKIAREFGGSEEIALPRRSLKDSQSNDNKPPKEVPRLKKKILEPSSDIEDPFTLRLLVRSYALFERMLIPF